MRALTTARQRLNRADVELIDLLIAMRSGGDWTPGNIRSVIRCADLHGLDWQHTRRMLLLVVEQPHATPAHALPARYR